MENERPEIERSSSKAEELAEYPFALPLGHPIQEYTIQGVLGATDVEITYLATDTQRGGTVEITEYFPDDMAMRLSDQGVSPILEKDEENYQAGLARFLEGARREAEAGGQRVLQANNTAYRVIVPAKSQPRPLAGKLPWRYFAMGAGMALVLVLAGTASYFMFEKNDKQAVAVALKSSPSPTPPTNVTTTVPTVVPEAMVTSTAPAPAPAPSLTPPIRIEPPVSSERKAPAEPVQKSAAKTKLPAQKKAPVKPEATAAAKGEGAAFIFDVTPAGRVYIDGKQIGATPPLIRVPVSPGWHRIEVHGTMPPGIYYYRYHLKPGENYRIVARFGDFPFQSQLQFTRPAGTRR